MKLCRKCELKASALDSYGVNSFRFQQKACAFLLTEVANGRGREGMDEGGILDESDRRVFHEMFEKSET